MTFVLLSSLIFLSLADSTSFGTLLIPVWLMLAPGRLRPGRIVVFLATVAGFYLVLGLALVAGLSVFSDELSDLMDTSAAQVVQVAVGAALLGAGLWLGLRKATGESGRLLRWRERAVGEGGSIRGLMALALTAALIEAASMVPYLAAIGLIGTADLTPVETVVTLVGYCAVMILPALVLLTGRVAAARVVEPVLRRLDDWIARTGRENTAWVLGIIGVVVAVTGLDALGVVDVLDG